MRDKQGMLPQHSWFMYSSQNDSGPDPTLTRVIRLVKNFHIRVESTPAILFFIVPLILYAGFSPLRDLYGIEARNALFAREMLENGAAFVPYLMGKPYPDYPPLYFFLEYIFSIPLGRITTLTAILPSAASAAGIITLTWLWTAGISRKIAWTASLILATSPGFWLKASHATVDMLLAFATLAAFYFLDKAYSRHPDPGNKQSINSLLPAAAAVFLAFLTKGPVGIIIPLGSWGLYLIMAKRWQDLYHFAIFAAGTAIAFSTVYMILIYLQGGTDLLSKVIESQVTDRIGSPPNRAWHYYPMYLLTSFIPWWLLACGFAVRAYRNRKKQTADRDKGQQNCKAHNGGDGCNPDPLFSRASRNFIKKNAAGLFFPLTMFAMASSRHGRYLLPVFPFIAILAAYAVMIICEKERQAGFIPGARCDHLYRGVKIMAICTAAVLVLYSALVEPVLSRAESGRMFIQGTEQMISTDTHIVLFAVNPDGDGVKIAFYSSRKPTALIFTYSSEELQALKGKYIIITYEKNLDRLNSVISCRKYKVLNRGLLHGKKVAAIELI